MKMALIYLCELMIFLPSLLDLARANIELALGPCLVNSLLQFKIVCR